MKGRGTVLGLDPSITRTGWCVLVGPPPVALSDIISGSFDKAVDAVNWAEWLAGMVDMYAPDFIAYEAARRDIAVYGKKGLIAGQAGFVTPNAAQLVLLELQGAIFGVAAAKGVPVSGVGPPTWRKAVLGDGHAAKSDAVTHCQRLGLGKLGHDRAEAVCVALWGASSQGFRYQMLTAGEVVHRPE